MGRNKGRQCGGHASKRDFYVLQRRMQQQVSHVVSKRRKERVRIDVVKALMNARLQDDHVELIQLKRVEAIATELQEGAKIEDCATLQERCLYVIAQTFELYSASCPYTQEFFTYFEPWMITRLSELTTAMKTVSDNNASLLLQRPTTQLTLGFVRQERSLALLTQQAEARQAFAWQSNHNDILGGFKEVDSWDELDIDDVDLVPTEEEDLQLTSLRLVSCRGLSISFLSKLTIVHPHLQELDLTDCFESDKSEHALELLRAIAQWHSLKTLRLSWCMWLTTESLVAFAHALLEPPATSLESIHIAHAFDVVDDYVRAVFAELHPAIDFTI